MPRYTNHGEVVYEAVSSLGANGAPATHHPFWGEHRNWWPHPITNQSAENPMACGACPGANKSTAPPDLATWYEAEKKTPPDFHEHMETLRALASTVKHATEMSIWPKQAYLAIAYGLPADGVFVSCAAGGKGWWPQMQRFLEPRFVGVMRDSLTAEIEPTELLFLDSAHTAQRTYEELKRHADKSSKYIVIHTVDAGTFGERGDDGGPGVMPGVRRWLKEGARDEWVVKRFDSNNHGLIVLSRDPADRPEIKLGMRSAYRFVKAMVKHKLNGGTYLPLPMAMERFDVCLTCDKRGGDTGNNCKLCGCYLTRLPDDAPANKGGPGKIFFPTENCPAGKWVDRVEDGVSMTAEQVEEMLDDMTVQNDA